MEIPLNKLVTSEDNVRRTRKDSGIEELAASIAAHGLLENLVVRPVVDDARKPTGAYEVLAGGRRLAALQLLVKRKKLGATTSVHCNVRSDGSAKELSLAENAMREALHPADQFEAFRDLHEEFGFGAEEIAARFGVTARVVKERMKLASAAIESLPPIQRNFFERDFVSKTFAQTKEQIRYRLNAILENPTLARLFTAPNTKIDLFAELNNGSIILVDTAKDFLKGASAHFGRIFISLVLQAVLERAVIHQSNRRPTFLIVDEAAAYFDGNIDDFLTEARKYRCGCVFAHQFLDQATSSLRASLAANTSIKMASGVSMSDARALAADMRTSAEFIISQPKLTFAGHIRNVTPSAVSIPVIPGEVERQRRLSPEAYEKLRQCNRDRVSDPQPAGVGNSASDPSGPAERTREQKNRNDLMDDPSAASKEG